MLTANAQNHWGYSQEDVRHYTCQRAAGPICIDGRLDEPSWKRATRSPRFVDLVDGRPGLFDTSAAVLWDDEYLYVGFWLDEPDIRATLTECDSMICRDNDVEVFIAGKDAYYEFELNAFGTIMERFYIWQDTYERSIYAQAPEFDLLGTDLVDTMGGPWTGFRHPRGRRWAFREWDFPGLKWAVHLEGSINDASDVDTGWTAEIAFPWKGMKWLADGRSLPGREGEVWRMDFSRFQHLVERGAGITPGWGGARTDPMTLTSRIVLPTCISRSRRWEQNELSRVQLSSGADIGDHCH